MTTATREVCVAIVGSRDFADRALLDATMDAFVREHGAPTGVVSGGARGADTLGQRWAQARGVPCTVLAPEWAKHGRSAGFRRSADIVAAATHVVAFPHPRGSGTQHTVELARRRGLPVTVVTQWAV